MNRARSRPPRRLDAGRFESPDDGDGIGAAWADEQRVIGVDAADGDYCGPGRVAFFTRRRGSVSTDSGARTVSGLTVDGNMAPKAMVVGAGVQQFAGADQSS